MTEYYIPDSIFNEAINDTDASVEDVNTFVNTLANKYEAQWEPVSNGYNLQFKDKTNAIALANDLFDHVEAWRETIS